MLKFLASLLCVLTLAGSMCGQLLPQPSNTKSERREIVGAIRWDAWFGDNPTTTVGHEVERSLSPSQWHYRLPFFAKEISPTQVQVRSNVQSVMDSEIRYAHDAGIDYWAFVMYPISFPATTGGLDLYFKSSHKGDIRFCMMLEDLDDDTVDRLVQYFKDESYQTVLGGRPLVYLLGPQSLNDPKWPGAKDAVNKLRQKAIRTGSKDPYLVHLWGWSGGKEVIDALHLNAMSAYSLNFDDKGAPYATLAAKTKAKWDEWMKTGSKVVPLVTAGWDRRPRVMNPVFWESPPKRTDEIQYYYEASKPEELAGLLQDALLWCNRNSDAAEANTILVYAWNEIDEGGWLVPSLWPDQGSRRLDAIRAILRP
jgi:Glycosyltransferase WbsX